MLLNFIKNIAKILLELCYFIVFQVFRKKHREKWWERQIAVQISPDCMNYSNSTEIVRNWHAVLKMYGYNSMFSTFFTPRRTIFVIS